jgi:acetyltransferase-like isoleucine patch superfamily enzyme
LVSAIAQVLGALSVAVGLVLFLGGGPRFDAKKPTSRFWKHSLPRILQRYFVPRPAISAYYLLRYRCFVSTQTQVQLSRQISFGKDTVVKPFAVIQTQTGAISIGHHCAISSFNHISTGTKPVILGDYVRLGPHVTILGGNRNFRRKDSLIVDQGFSHQGVTIGSDVLIGAGAVILPGCQIGEGAVIGAGSVVTQDVPPYTIVAGVPARVMGKRE